MLTIDMHVHGGFIEDIAKDPERVAFRRKHFGLYKQHIWPLELVVKQLDAAGLDKAVLMPEDLQTREGGSIISNEEIKTLVDALPDRFIGFASVDPHREDAIEVLDKAFHELNLAGLRMNPATQRFYPNDDFMAPIYAYCIANNKPVVLDLGMSLEPNAPSKYALPLYVEDVLLQYPDLRVCAAHFAYPWVLELSVLMLRYANLYADTSILYFDSPKQFFHQVFEVQIGPHWIDRTLNRQVMFASNYPRIEQQRMVEALDTLDLRPQTRERVMGGNALTFLNGDGGGLIG